jgi:hypothetical protein
MKFNLFNYTITIKEKKKKQKTWKPKTYGKFGTDAPLPPKGYVHRWIRSETLKNTKWKRKNKRGFAVVKASDHRESFPYYTTGIFKGCIGMGGLVLVKIPERFVA